MRWLLLVLAACHASPSPPHAFDEDHIEAINGTRLHYRVRGTDRSHPYLLILHGGPGASSFEFYPWGAQLERELNVVYLDERGCGLSDKAPDETFTFENLVADVEGVRERIGVPRWYVLGHSFGGMYGVEYVVAHPEHVIGYIHMAGLISVPMIDEDWLAYGERAGLHDIVSELRALPQNELDEQLGPRLISKLQDQMIHDRFPAANDYDARIDAEVVQRYHVDPQVFSRPEPRRALKLATRDVLDKLPRVSRPTLVLGGAQDPLIPPARVQLAHDRIPGSQMLIVEQAGHELYKDQPAKTAASVLAFVHANR